jgi:hypothetical protein
VVVRAVESSFYLRAADGTVTPAVGHQPARVRAAQVELESAHQPAGAGDPVRFGHVVDVQDARDQVKPGEQVGAGQW